jgi:myosin heavy subunit
MIESVEMETRLLEKSRVVSNSSTNYHIFYLIPQIKPEKFRYLGNNKSPTENKTNIKANEINEAFEVLGSYVLDFIFMTLI